MDDDSLSIDQRHLLRMRDAIESYYAKQMAFGRMINNLETLLGLLEHASEDWRDKFLHEWGKLEDILAVAADRGQPSLIDENEKSINEALSRLLAMIEIVRLGRQKTRARSRAGLGSHRSSFGISFCPCLSCPAEEQTR